MTHKFYHITQKGERANIEFKESLYRDFHLKKDRIQRLASQMKYRLERGDGSAIYFLGVDDSGNMQGLSPDKMEESLDVLGKVAQEINSDIREVEQHSSPQGEVARVVIRKREGMIKEHLLIGVAGHVDHGKSSLVGTLTTGNLDDGKGRTRIFLDVQKHEIERGLSADLSFAVYGFIAGQAVRVKNPLNKKEKSELVGKCDRLVSFVDTVGHEPWLRTTIRGIVGQKLDYGILVIAADQGPTHITKEHLGIMLAMELPVLVIVTKIDIISPERILEVEKEIFHLLKLVGRIPYRVKTSFDVELVSSKINQHLVPLINVSPVTGEGLNLLDQILYKLPLLTAEEEHEKPFLMYIDKIYAVTGVGTVVSGTVRQGRLCKGDKLLLGPTSSGNFRTVSVKSIEMHHYKKEKAGYGDVVGVSITGNIPSIRRGMILAHPKLNPVPVREFEAEVVILVHPTTIRQGYECIMHIETLAETAIIEPLHQEYLCAGDSGQILVRFKYRPCYVKEGQKIIFREGRSKGLGRIIQIKEQN